MYSSCPKRPSSVRRGIVTDKSGDVPTQWMQKIYVWANQVRSGRTSTNTPKMGKINNMRLDHLRSGLFSLAEDGERATMF
jgi:hypothetical protein